VDSFIQDLLLGLIVFILFLLICREIVCWYFKINQTVSLLEEIRDSMKPDEKKVTEKDNIKLENDKKNEFSFTE